MQDWTDEELINYLREAFHHVANATLGSKSSIVPFAEKLFNSACYELMRRLGHEDFVFKPTPSKTATQKERSC